MRLHSKVAIVTGSAQGIGESIATLFAQEGASVVLLDTLQAEGQKLETILQSKGLSVVFIPMDVTDQTAWTNAVNTTIQRFGKVDILVNNAYEFGPNTGFGQDGRLDSIPKEKFMRSLESGVWWPMLATQVIGEHMKERKTGSIINISYKV